MDETTELCCKNCGAPLDCAPGGVGRCGFCGSVFTLPKANQTDEVKRLIDAGKTALDVCRFDEALTHFSRATELDGTEPEGYWGRALARHRVQYLHDAVNNRLQPICHAVLGQPFSDDPDYGRALSLATPEQREAYGKKAAEIDYIRSEFAALEREGLAYDCFLCVKVTDDADGRPTADSRDAGRIYTALKRSGVKPFYSEYDLIGCTGADYEARILYALHKAPCLIVVCSDGKYLESKWVKNEYSRYRAMAEDGDKDRDSIAIVYRGKVIERLPGIPGRLQGVNFSDGDAIDRIRAFVARHGAERDRRRAEAAAAAERTAREAAERETARRRAEAERAAAERAAEEKARAERLRAETERAEQEKARQKVLRRTPRYERSDLPRETRLKADAAFAVAWLAFIAALVLSVAGMFIYGFVEALPLRPVWFPVWIVIEALGGIAIVVFLIAAHKADGAFCRRVPPWLLAGLIALYAAAVTLTVLGSLRPSAGMSTAFITVFGCFWGVMIALFVFYIIRAWRKGGYMSTFLTAAILIPLALVSLPVGNVAAMAADYWAEYDGYAEGYYYAVKDDGTVAAAAAEYDGAEVTIPAELSGRKVTEVLRPFRYTGSDGVRTLVIPEGVTEIGEYAFSSCDNLQSVTLPGTLLSIKRGAFQSIDALTEIVLPEGVTEIGEYAFYSCDNLRSVTLPATLLSIKNGAFQSCGLTEITLPEGMVFIGEYAFMSCDNLKSVTLPSTLERISNGAFSNCKALTLINIPANVIVEEWAFSNCSALTTVTVKERCLLNAYAFANCTELASVTVLTESTIGEYAFWRCTALSSADIGAGGIGDRAFSDCSALDRLTLRNTVGQIGSGAFFGCKALHEVHIPISVTGMGMSVFSGCSDDLVLYCEAERQPSGWDAMWNSDESEVVWGTAA